MAASREEVYERVKEVLTEQLGIDEADITEEASFQEDLEPLVRGATVGRPRRMGEDMLGELGRELVDQMREVWFRGYWCEVT